MNGLSSNCAGSLVKAGRGKNSIAVVAACVYQEDHCKYAP
jgi:hypothetical protein